MHNQGILISLKDLYQLLIAELRYGYTRNNHLMPEGAYERVKQLYSTMLEEDKEWTINTLKQACEECISLQLVHNFYYGIDDDYNNRDQAIDFIKWCLVHIREEELKYIPYNIDSFEQNLKLDNEVRFDFYKGKEKLTSVSKNEFLNTLSSIILKDSKDELKESIIYNKEKFNDYTTVYHIHQPVVEEITVIDRIKQRVLCKK